MRYLYMHKLSANPSTYQKFGHQSRKYPELFDTCTHNAFQIVGSPSKQFNLLLTKSSTKAILNSST